MVELNKMKFKNTAFAVTYKGKVKSVNESGKKEKLHKLI